MEFELLFATRIVLEASKCRERKKPRALKAPAAHPKYVEMIVEAISALKERTGSSQPTIAKYLESKYKTVQKKKLVQIKYSFKLAEGVKKLAKPTAKPKVKAPKATKATGEKKAVAPKPKKAASAKLRAVPQTEREKVQPMECTSLRKRKSLRTIAKTHAFINNKRMLPKIPSMDPKQHSTSTRP
ncbi:hypothetical protein KP509_13G007600 [Ceratopteris richardii]|uniref:H15 domain-containing protein n=1 Tax=Ceratopteris richardii TaxID=49495 RepID=A0A8T2TF25_CERRI|nr:hypothetical protein KP509_13G007600 [Ceratopteris richardii]